jgi:hypothetical protein
MFMVLETIHNKLFIYIKFGLKHSSSNTLLWVEQKPPSNTLTNNISLLYLIINLILLDH